MNKHYTSNSPSPEFQFMVLACRQFLLGKAAPALEALIQQDPLDWELLDQWAAYHRIRPLLYKSLRQYGQSPTLPPSIEQRWRNRYRSTAMSNLALSGQLMQMQQLLAGENIEPIPFKGVYLAANVYGDLGLRPCVDLDVFVHKDDIPTIYSIYSQRGYENPYRINPETDQWYMDRYFDLSMDLNEGENRIFHLEFHWRLARKGLCMNIDRTYLEPFTRYETVQGIRMKVLRPELNLLVTAGHHGGKDYWQSLKDLFDIAIIIKETPDFDWNLFFREARRFGLYFLCLNGINIARELFRVSLPEAVIEKLSHPKVKRLTEDRMAFLQEIPQVARFPVFRSLVESWKYQIKARDKWTQRVRVFFYYFHVFQPTIEDLKASSLPRPFWSFLYLTKPFKMISKYLFGR